MAVMKMNLSSDTIRISIFHQISLSATVVDTFGIMGEHPLTDLVIVDIETETTNSLLIHTV